MNKQMASFGLVVGAILATGLILDMAGSGQLGSQAQGIARKVTQGYGV